MSLKSGDKFKTWRGLLTQATTGDPTAVVLENEVGTIVWARSGAGVYTGTLVGAFIEDKTVVSVQPSGDDTKAASIVRTDDDTVTISTFDAGSPADDELTDAEVRIDIYL